MSKGSLSQNNSWLLIIIAILLTLKQTFLLGYRVRQTYGKI